MRGYRFFLNRKNCAVGFQEAVNGKSFVDKSDLIEFLNRKISTKEKWICVSRPRRFGKTYMLEMLNAYYTKGGSTDALFGGLKIKNSASYDQHLNSHNVISVNFSDYFENTYPSDGGIELFSKRLLDDLRSAYPGMLDSQMELSLALDMIQQETGDKFIFLIDEWDSIFRFMKGNQTKQEEFLGFLKNLFKDKPYVELVYMTGILPIKKYSTGSALNMFREYTMLDPKSLGPYFGFSEKEVSALCEQNNTVPMQELTEWYDGYSMEQYGHIYNPKSVVEALEEGVCKDYWNRTGGFSELEEYITLNFDGLRETVTALVAGEKIAINVVGFSNDLDSFQDKDEVLTALIHLGYLTYENGMAYIPNKELREEFSNTVKKLQWGTVSKLLNQSRRLLKDTLEMNAARVAQGLEDVHDDMQEFKEYSNEHTLKCVLHLAYYAAADEYEMRFEANAGKGFADCVMIPKNFQSPGIILELKYDGSASKALEQIEKRGYLKSMPEKVQDAILVGINYDKKTKVHQCVMKKVRLPEKR